jgi:hypothetical protein
MAEGHLLDSQIYSHHGTTNEGHGSACEIIISSGWNSGARCDDFVERQQAVDFRFISVS